MNTEGVDVKLDMLTGMIQKLGEEIKGKLNIFKEEWRELQTQIQELKKDTEIIKGQVDELKKGEGDTRNRNLVIFGWKCEENENNFDTYKRVRDLFAKVLRISPKNIQINKINRIGKRKINRLLLIRFTNSMIKEYVLERKGWFKGCKLRVEDDYNEEVCNIRKKLVEYMFEARRRGEHAVLLKDKVLISGIQFDLEACRKNYKRGVEDTKERVNDRTRTNEEGKIEVEITKEQQDKERKDIGSERKTISQGDLKALMEGLKDLNESMNKGFQKWNSQLRGESKEKAEVSGQETAEGQEQRNDKNVEMNKETGKIIAEGVGQQTCNRK